MSEGVYLVAPPQQEERKDARRVENLRNCGSILADSKCWIDGFLVTVKILQQYALPVPVRRLVLMCASSNRFS
jgi:hypothetical protein